MLHEATPPSPREVSRFPNGGTVRVTGTRRPQEVHWQPRGRARDTLILWIEAADGGIDHLGTGISIAHHSHPFFVWRIHGRLFLAFELGFALYETL